MWVARHAELRGDALLGAEKPLRFPPTRFTIEGNALDARGMVCRDLACPECHLVVPRDLIDIEPLFLSIVGTPSSGKSYLLAAMSYMLRQTMPAKFAVTFNDADPLFNRSLKADEQTLFLAGDADRPVAIEKTKLTGELYDEIQKGEQIIRLPRPLVFTVRPSSKHPNASRAANVNRVICLYDNAGEHFRPGMDETGTPVTQHLAKARALLFVYDPTQDPRFRNPCRAFSNDPQLSGSDRLEQQETVLTEAAIRIRRYASLPSSQRIGRPLIVLVSKSDIWGPLLQGEDISTEPIVEHPGRIAALDVPRIERVSAKLEALMRSIAPDFVGAAEDFSDHVVYLPVSALGCAPEPDPGGRGLLVRPSQIKPRWVTVPILYAFAKWSSGMVPAVKASRPS